MFHYNIQSESLRRTELSNMAGSSIKVLGTRPSPFVNRVEIALNIKSVDYEFITEDIFNKSELLLNSNPAHKKIPVLIHGNKPICESLVIVQYIDETWTNGPSILPSDPHDRAIARFWATYVENKWFPFMLEVREAVGKDEKEAALQKIVEGLCLLEEAFVKCSKGKDFFGGDNIGYIDITLGCFLGWIRAMEMMLGLNLIYEAQTPGLAGWAERFLSEKVVKDVILSPDKLVEIYSLLQAQKQGASAN
ncbi:glutathione S-transferase U17-like [Lycium ferocissimum]|uniref:glutathione S-transferase U17-like n=1 Tax=Lycium ferocissimum TaxID=112874 RepID=UPI002814A8C9|nr:glutathione S-transferase U17-like [Lycium ferocissimum]